MESDNNFDDINLRSEEVQDILTKIPHWMIRWGNAIIFIIILLIFIFTYIIKYPDIVKGNIVITTQNPPEKLVARKSGRIQHILVKDHSIIEKETPLAVIENSANYKDVYFLKNIIDSIDINKNDINLPLIKTASLSLGDIEGAYAVLVKDFLAYQINREFQPYNIDKFSQNIEGNEQKERLRLLIEQNNIALVEMEYKAKDLERHKKLFDKGVISAQEYDNKNIEYLQQKKNINSLNGQISGLRSSLNNLGRDRKTTNLSENKDLLTLKRNLILSFNQLKKSIAEWEMNYILKSSTTGQISFLKIWAEQQNISIGENVFVVIPKIHSNYLGRLKASSFNSGKIKVGQSVNVRLTNYPDREFGIIKGKVKTISLVPDEENNFIIDIELPKGLKTSYNKKIRFQQEMSGTADIITEDLRLIERVLYRFKDIFNP